MQIAVPKETYPGDQRVALTPAAAAQLVKLGLQVVIEAGAGDAAGFADEQYTQSGARVEAERDALFAADAVLFVRTLGANPDAGLADLPRMRDGQLIIGLGDPLSATEAARQLADRRVTLFALELLPRITRAQSMDVLSSMATLAGYKSVLLAASSLPKMFPMMMTAAGTIAAAKVLVIGAGVAGLQAIATARRLGAVVSGYDVRPAVKEQVESLGAKFVELDLDTAGAEGKGGYAKAQDAAFYAKQQELLGDVIAQMDVCITTAAIPGKQAPRLIAADVVRRMRAGSVIVDLAAERGGNCELSQPDQTVVDHGVTILGPTNLPGTMPHDASQMYARNMATFVKHLTKEGRIELDLEDEITRETLVTHQGEVVHSRVREILGLGPLQAAPPAEQSDPDEGIPLDES